MSSDLDNQPIAQPSPSTATPVQSPSNFQAHPSPSGRFEIGQPIDEIDDGYENDDIEPDSGSYSIGGYENIPLSPFEKIKLEADRRTAHGHPVILPTKYGEYGGAYDIFALFQNSLKKQLLVAYNTLEGLLRYKFAVSRDEVNLFFDWFDIFTDTALAFLAVEEEELFPFLENNKIELPAKLSKAERMKLKDKMASALQNIDSQRNMFKLLPPPEIVPRITTLVPQFLNSIVDYYDIQSLHLPMAVQKANINKLENSKVAPLRSQIMKSLKSRPNYNIYVVFMSHWLKGSKLKAWKSEFLTTMDSFRYEQWIRKFINNYQSLPKELLDTLMAETAGGDSTDGSNSNLSFYLNRKKNMYKV